MPDRPQQPVVIRMTMPNGSEMVMHVPYSQLVSSYDAEGKRVILRGTFERMVRALVPDDSK